MRHGTNGGTAQHYRAGEKPCESCRAVTNRYNRRYRANGPLFRGTYTSDRITEFLDVEGPHSLSWLMACVEGDVETVRRTVYRMVGRGDITRNPVTLCYSVGSEER